MKTIYIFASFLGLQFNTILAAGNLSGVPVSINNAANITYVFLPAVIPAEAKFEESPDMTDNTLFLSGLTPMIPVTAESGDEAPANEVNFINLAPVMQKEIDLEDETITAGFISIVDLAPEAPSYAEFEDYL